MVKKRLKSSILRTQNILYLAIRRTPDFQILSAESVFFTQRFTVSEFSYSISH